MAENQGKHSGSSLKGPKKTKKETKRKGGGAVIRRHF